jgi:hypothetical protein
MKKYLRILILAIATGLPVLSCEEYLSEAPQATLVTDVVFSKYDNLLKYFNAVYNGSYTSPGGTNDYSIKNAYSLYKVIRLDSWEMKTDMSDPGLRYNSMDIKMGQMGGTIMKFAAPYSDKNVPILYAMFKCIRVCNMTLKNINLLQDARQEDIDDLIGQAHFIRAFAHFTLFKIWGPMPYITKPLAKGEEWDIPRLSRFETCMKIAQDFDTACIYFRQAGVMRRDKDLQFNDPRQAYPTGVAAIAMKSRVLLYAASPQNNKNGIPDWEEAAKASLAAIDTALYYKYGLQTAAQSTSLKQAYKNNFMNMQRTNEQLWPWFANADISISLSTVQSSTNGVFAQSPTAMSGEYPTQNFIDCFETRWGDPLNTEQDRQVAISIGHYVEQNPYANRDLRLTWGIVFNQSMEVPGYSPANIYYEIQDGRQVWSDLLDHRFLGITNTGYYQRKTIYDANTKVTSSFNLTDPNIRLAELYLNYAEAAAQAYGGQNGMVPGSGLTAGMAANIVRTRVNMPGLPNGLSPEAFMKRLKNERNIELCFEGHYYFDIRRWLDAPAAMTSTLYGMDIEKVPSSTAYPTGFRYTRVPLPADRQPAWKDAMYTFPFITEDNYKMKNFTPNPVW